MDCGGGGRNDEVGAMPRLTLTFDNGPTPGVTDRVLATLAERAMAANGLVS
jgi:peptidoglycan/xylan/chitin deacetylase (PgdA/CDA1 family)